MTSLDLLCMGRSSIDLYSNDIGAPFAEIKSFAAYVGGSPTNIAVGARRLGLNSGVLTAVGQDPVGDFILQFLRREGMDTCFIPRKPQHRTSAVVLGIEPPDRFPLVYYRANAADIELTIDDVQASPIKQTPIFQFAGTNLSREPSRSATIYAAETAKAAGATVVMDIDFRPDQWHDVRAFGVVIRSVLRLVDIVIGTEDEINATRITRSDQMLVTDSQMSGARVKGSEDAIKQLLALGPELVVQKLGAEGAALHYPSGEAAPVPGYPVEVINVLGAGDAFAAGFLYGLRKKWSLYRCVRLGNACGAILVTKHGCAEFMPTMAEVEAFTAPFGGLE
jgi:5-dehydro-2-deoxygluconokinase